MPFVFILCIKSFIYLLNKYSSRSYELGPRDTEKMLSLPEYTSYPKWINISVTCLKMSSDLRHE